MQKSVTWQQAYKQQQSRPKVPLSRLSSVQSKALQTRPSVSGSSSPPSLKPKVKRDFSWWASRVAILGFILIVLGLVAGVSVFAYFSRGLPDPSTVIRHDGYASKIFDRNGNLLYDVYDNEKRIPVTVEQIPEDLKHATVAVEDKDFYTHPGFDLKGIIRGASRLITDGRAEGGSTLTQQLVKNVLLTNERSLVRKIREFVLAIQIERKFSKDEILQMYLNEAPYGGTAWGVGAASETYFGKQVQDLTLAQSVILAGLPQSPTAYSPYGSDPTAYIPRAQHVLNRMKADGYVTEEQFNQVATEINQMQFNNEDTLLKAPHFVMYVKKELTDRYGEDAVERGGLRVTTSLDLPFQEKIQGIVTEEIQKVIDFHITNGASLVMNPQTGEILAMVGSRGYNDPDYDGKVNVTMSMRQPGSSIKPLVYAAALREGYTASTMYMDVPTEFPGGAGQPAYTPVNYDGKFRGPVLLRESLGNSLNIPAVKTLARVGLKKTLTLGYEMGFTTLEPTKETMSRLGLSFALGGGEVRMLDLVRAYSAFANGGHKVEPVAILKVEDGQGHVLEEFSPSEGAQVLSPQESWLISDILQDNNARKQTFGEHNSLQIPNRQVAVKTGTTNNKRDNWTIGWTPSVITAVWVGNNDNSQMKQLASGITGAAPIWRRIIMAALEGKPVESFTKPEGMVELEVDTISGYKSHDGFVFKKENYITGTEPDKEDPTHVMLKVCKGDNSKLANAVLIGNGDYDQKEAYLFKEDDPLQGTDGINKWQVGIDGWLAAPERKSDFKYNPPKEYCDSGGGIALYLREPNDQSSVSTNDVKIKVDVVSVNEIKKVEFFVDDKIASSFAESPYEDTVHMSDGYHTIKARAEDDKGNVAERTVAMTVNMSFVTPTPLVSPTPTEEP